MFDLRLLKAFVTIFDAGSFTLAADRLHMTQSTISQQLARLEDVIGQPLINRQTRPLQLTTSGEYLIGYARRILALQLEAEMLLSEQVGMIPIQIGLPEDIMNVQMAECLSLFSQEHARVRLDVTAGLSRDLMQRYRHGQLDIVIVKEAAASTDYHATFIEEMAWFESLDHSRQIADPVPLVAFPPGGLYREEMFNVIERHGKHWYVALTSNSLASILVGVETGLGLSLLPVAATKGYRVRQNMSFGQAPAMMISIYSWDKTGLAARLASKMTAVLAARWQQTLV